LGLLARAASRRDLLKNLGQGALGLSAGSLLLERLALAADTEAKAAPPIVDTHTHFFDPTRPEGVPWPSKQSELYRKVLPADFLAVAAPHGVNATIVVEASSWLEDNQWLLDLAERETSILGIIGRLTPGEERFAGDLARFTKNGLFRGFRVSAAQVKQGLNQPAFMADLGRMADRGLTLDVNGSPEMLPDVERLSKGLPNLRIVVEHVANVEIDGKAPPADWLRGMEAVAKHDHASCKVSALVEGAGRGGRTAPADVEFYRPLLDALWSAFGPDRLMYGSNWPVSARAADYGTVFRIASAYFREKGKPESEKFLGGNALKIYGCSAR
jgi:predicted TIM-barrel fold metal-dependent hydrolase